MKIVVAVLAGLACLAFASTANADPKRYVGLGVDIGVPDGLAASVVVSPGLHWLRGQASVTTNIMSPGWRLGATFDPIEFPISPSITAEYGEYGFFNPSGLVGQDLPHISYSYTNLHLGVEIGRPGVFRIFLRGGPTWVNFTSCDTQSIIHNEDVILTDPRASFFGPSAKFGFSYLFL